MIRSVDCGFNYLLVGGGIILGFYGYRSFITIEYFVHSHSC